MGAPKGRPKPAGSGRKKGGLNKVTLEAKEFAKKFLSDPVYLVSLQERVHAGDAPHMETLLWHYAHGKPKDRVELSSPEDRTLEIVISGVKP